MDYNKISNQVFCPHCGKLLKGKKHSAICSWFGDDPDDDYGETYETFKCKECNISASTMYFPISDIKAWNFPKDYQTTITPKQYNYIKYLGRHFKCLPVITSKELATEWISQFVKLLEEEKREELYIKAITEVFKKYGYEYWRVCNSSKELMYEVLDWGTIYYNKENKTYTVGLQSGSLDKETLPIFINTITKLPTNLNSIMEEINQIEYPDEQAGKDKLEQDKQEFKENISAVDCYDDEWDEDEHF